MMKFIPNIDIDLKITDEIEYLDWLSSLKKGDYALCQRFQPKNEKTLTELWFFDWVKISASENKGKTIIGQSRSSPTEFNFGRSENFHSSCFCCRLVPVVESVSPTFEKADFREYSLSRSYCLEPIYEPGWNGQRHYLLQRFPRFDRFWRKEKNRLHKAFPHFYSFGVTTGELFVVFPGEDFDSYQPSTKQKIELFLDEHNFGSFYYLYSEPLS